MAIVDMKRLTVLAMRADTDRLLKRLQRLGCVQVTPASDAAAPEEVERDREQAREDIARLTWGISKLARFDHEKRPAFGLYPETDVQTADEALSHMADTMAAIAHMEDIERRAGEMRGEEARAHAQLELLTPWQGLDIPLRDVAPTRCTQPFLGSVSARRLDALLAALRDLPVTVQQIGQTRDQTCLYVLCHRDALEQTRDALKEQAFAPAALSGFECTPAQRLREVEERLSAFADERARLDDELASVAKRLPDMKLLHDLLSTRLERLSAAARMTVTDKTILLRGWVPAEQAEHVKTDVQKHMNVCAVEIVDPEPGDEPPVLLHNPRLSAPYESVIEGFALPAPGAVDPTRVMAPFYACLFGMMVSDAGYGILLSLGIPLFIYLKKIKPKNAKVMWVLAMGGVFTILWGALYNTWFGFSPWPSLFNPIEDPMPVMILGIGVGAIHLFAGLGVGVYQNIRRGKPWDAVCDQLSWFLLIVGIGLLVLPQTAGIAPYVAALGGGIILLTAGRYKSKNPIKRLISGLGALYGITSWISDLLSYMRLFGMGLATGVIGMVINQLVGMAFDLGPIGVVVGAVLFVGAHLFNCAINVLGAYVHACRLQYIEFFGKFFEEGGKPFTPLSTHPRYVRVRDGEQS